MWCFLLPLCWDLDDMLAASEAKVVPGPVQLDFREPRINLPWKNAARWKGMTLCNIWWDLQRVQSLKYLDFILHFPQSLRRWKICLSSTQGVQCQTHEFDNLFSTMGISSNLITKLQRFHSLPGLRRRNLTTWNMISSRDCKQKAPKNQTLQELDQSSATDISLD